MKPILFILILLIVFLVGCQSPTGQVVKCQELDYSKCPKQFETITKYQCQNGEVVDSIELCAEQKCPTCPQKVCEDVKEPYVESTSYDYTFMYGVVSDSTEGTLLDLINYGTEQKTVIKNFDSKKGKFTVKHHYRTLNKEGTKEISLEIDSDETKDFITTFDTELGEDVEVKTEIIPATETRYKEVIKYKQVERCSIE